MPTPSPCTNLCRLTADSVCEGCQRTLAEILAWRDMTENEKKAVLDRLDSAT